MRSLVILGLPGNGVGNFNNVYLRRSSQAMYGCVSGCVYGCVSVGVCVNK